MALDKITLAEYMAQSQRANGGGGLAKLAENYFGKSTSVVQGNYLLGNAGTFNSNTTFTATYGKKVWDALNNKTVTFNALKKVDWGATVGWRLRTDRKFSGDASRSSPVSENGQLPAISNSTYVGVLTYPKQIASVFGVTLKAQAISALEGGIGNQFAVEQEAASRDHVKEIGTELTLNNYTQISAYSASDTAPSGATLPSVTAYASYNFRPGDTVGFFDDSASADAASTATVKEVSSTKLFFVAIPTNSYTPANHDLVYATGRGGSTSIDDIINVDSAPAMTTSANAGGILAKANAYNYTSLGTRTAGTYLAAANVDSNAGVKRDLTLASVDRMFQTIRQAGGEPKLIVTGLDQFDRFNQLLQAQQRFVDVSDFIVGVGDERTYPGTRAGFQLATYRGVPILPDPNMATSYSDGSATANGSNIYCMDTDYAEVAVMYPTQYVENRDYLALGTLAIRGMFVTLLENRFLRADVHAVIRNLNS